MQNDFEKQVQQKMEELDLVPSAPVWEKIESQIRDNKDRRRYILWLFLILFIGGGGVTWFISQSENNSSSATTRQPQQSLENKTSENNSVKPDISDTKQPASEQEKQTEFKQNQKIEKNREPNDDYNTLAIERPEQIATSNNQTNTISRIDETNFNKSSGTTKSDLVKPGSNQTDKVTRTGSKKTKTTSIPVVQDYRSDEKRSIETNTTKSSNPAEEKNSVPGKKTVDSVSIDKKPDTLHAVVSSDDINKNELVTDNTVPAVDSIPTVAPDLALSKPKSSKWKFGFKASMGISGLGEGISLTESSGNKALLDAFPQASPSNVARVPYSREYAPPSKVQNNIGFSVAVSVKKEIGNRLSVSSALGYEQYSTLLESGKTDSTLVSYSGNNSPSQAFRAGGAFRNYNNIFHFISLPLNLHFQLFKKTPLNVYGGMAVKYMVATSAMEYNQLNSSYSKDVSLYNKTQVYSNFGFEYALLNKKNQLLVGPELTYGISKHLNTGSSQHLYSIGIKAEFLFQKK